MTRFYDEITDNNDGAVFPDTRAIDSSGPLNPDGTEIIKGVINDIWLEKQSLLDFYNYPPIGLEDFAGDVVGIPFSQPLTIQYMNYATPGTIVNWASEYDPVFVGANFSFGGMDIRLLLLHGQAIFRADYIILDKIVYVGNQATTTPDEIIINDAADSFYHATTDIDPTNNRDINGDWLILPDARGYSFRGLDQTGVIDPDGASRIVGSEQEDAFQNITGEFYLRQKSATPKNVIIEGIGSGLFSFDGNISAGENTEIESTGNLPPVKVLDRIRFNADFAPNTRTATETRAKNIATHYAIHY